MASVNEAYCILRDPEARRKYDAELQRYQSLFGSRSAQASRDQTSADRTDRNAHGTASGEDYVFDDKILEEWIRQARTKARDLAKQSLDDLVGISTTATKTFFSELFSGFACAIAILLIILLISFIA